MAESIGNLYSTKIPSLSEVADVQEAFRLYHYGAPSGTGTGEYDPTNTNSLNLVNPSIAYTLNNLQTQITTISGSLGVQATNWSAKGVIVTATAPSTLYPLTLGSEGAVLTVDSGAAAGMSWQSPVVTLTNTVTLSGKTLTNPRISAGSYIADINGNELIQFPQPVTSAVNEISVTNAATGQKPTISASGGDTNITLNLVSKGTGTVQANGIDIVTLSGTQTLTNKTITAPTVSQLYVTDTITFEGTTADGFETTLQTVDPTADRIINLPNTDGTVITTGNLSDITISSVSGTSLPATVVNSSLTSVGTLTSLSVTGNAVYHTVPESKSANYPLVLTDDGKILEMSAAGTFQIPTDASVNFPIGTQITVIRTGSGAVNIAAITPGTTTVNATPGLTLRAQWSSATLLKRAANNWVVIGDLI